MDRKALYRKLDKLFGIPILIILALFLKRRKKLPIEIKKILVVKFAAIGDSIMMIPMLRTLRRAYPDSEITFLCSRINESIVRKTPYVNKVLVENVHDFLKNPFLFLRMIMKLRNEKYNIVIDTEQWSRISAIIIALLKYDFSVGFKTQGQYKHFMFNRVINHSREKHELETFIDLLLPLFVPVRKTDYVLEYFLDEGNYRTADKFFEENSLKGRTVITLHQGCGGTGKPREWDVKNYIQLGKRLIEYKKDIVLLITGSGDEEEKNEELERGLLEILPSGSRVINITGKYSLDDVVAIIKNVTLIVCSNTGMLHLASCVGTKTMGLHGPTNPAKWGAYSPNTVLIQSDKYCSPCLYLGHDYGCNNPTCMTHISVDDVYIHIRKALNPELFPEELRVIN